MKFDKKEVLKAFLPILLDILKGILAYLRSHKMGDDKEFEKGLSQAAVLARCIIGESESITDCRRISWRRRRSRIQGNWTRCVIFLRLRIARILRIINPQIKILRLCRY